MFYILLGIILGIWLDQTFTIPPLQNYIDKTAQNLHKQYHDQYLKAATQSKVKKKVSDKQKPVRKADQFKI